MKNVHTWSKTTHFLPDLSIVLAPFSWIFCVEVDLNIALFERGRPSWGTLFVRGNLDRICILFLRIAVLVDLWNRFVPLNETFLPSSVCCRGRQVITLGTFEWNSGLCFERLRITWTSSFSRGGFWRHDGMNESGAGQDLTLMGILSVTLTLSWRSMTFEAD